MHIMEGFFTGQPLLYVHKTGPSTISAEREINYGADISTLVRIEEGTL
jgi:hypothetical protein